MDKAVIHSYINYRCGNCNLENRLDALTALLDSGADVDERDNEKGRTPLQAACWEKDDGAVIRTLLKYGAFVTATDNNGDTALHLAAFYDEGYKKWPLDYSNADFDPEYIEKYHPWGAKEAVNALVDAGADPNAISPNDGNTPMHWAAVFHIYAYLEFLEALFERGGAGGYSQQKRSAPHGFFFMTKITPKLRPCEKNSETAWETDNEFGRGRRNPAFQQKVLPPQIRFLPPVLNCTHKHCFHISGR